LILFCFVKGCNELILHVYFITGATASIFWAFGLPSIKNSLYFHQSSEHAYIRDRTGKKDTYSSIK